MRKRNLVHGIMVISLLSALIASQALAAEKYPSRQIELVTANPPGGVVDIAVRLITDNLAKELGVPVVVANRPGAGGGAGTNYLIKSKPDGYTFGSLSSRDAVLVPATIPNIPYKYTDLDPLCKYVVSPTIVFCKSDAPWKALEDLIADAKKRPGQITYAATTNSVSHFMMEGFQKSAGIKMMHIPLQAAAETITRVLGGNLDIGIVSIAPLVGQLKAGTLRGLFVAAEEGLKAFPQIPTLKAKGYRDPVLTLYTGFFAPLGLPKPIKETLTKALEKTIKDPAVAKKVEDVGELVLEYMPTEPFAKEIEEDYKQVVQIFKETGGPKK